MNKLLDIDNLQVEFDAIRALDGVSLSLAPAARMGIVGESGSGKSTLGLAVLGLLPEAAHSSGQVRFNGTPLPWHDDVAMTALRGNRIGFIHQDPMGAFSPVHTIGTHLARAYLAANPGTSRAGGAQSRNRPAGLKWKSQMQNRVSPIIRTNLAVVCASGL